MKTSFFSRSWVTSFFTLLFIVAPFIVFAQDDWGFANQITPYARSIYRILKVIIGLLVAADIIWIAVKVSQRDSNLRLQVIGLIVLIGVYLILPAIINQIGGISVN